MENIGKAPTLANSVPVIDMASYLKNGETILEEKKREEFAA